MQIDRRITNGLAWAGAALVVAIPAADYVSGTLMKPQAPQLALLEEVTPAAVPPAKAEAGAVAAATPKPVAPTPQTRPAEPARAEVAEAAPTTTPARSTGGNAVDAYLQSGKALPSYISDGSATQPATVAAPPVAPVTAAATPARPVVEAPVAPADSAPVAVASVAPQHVAPVPMPLSMRPASLVRPPVTATPAQAALPQQEAPLVIDEPEPVITAEDLDDWESGPLSDFLARRDRGQQAQVAPDTYQPNGFFLDQAPNSSARFQQFPRAYQDDDVIYLVR